MFKLRNFLKRRSTDGNVSAKLSFSFARAKSDREPIISVICINKNHRRYLETSILSILAQDFDNFELIVVDGGSTDGSIEFLAAIPFVRVVHDPQSSRFRGILRGYSEARGEIVMVTTSTDGYLCRGWLRAVYDTLSKMPEISLVWGASAAMNEQEILGSIVHPDINSEVPQAEFMFNRWIDHGFTAAYLPELNYGIRRCVLKRLLADSNYSCLATNDPILHVHFEFFRQGYLPFYLPAAANFGRSHDNQFQNSQNYNKFLTNYELQRRRYSDELKTGRMRHVFHDGACRPLREFSWH